MTNKLEFLHNKINPQMVHTTKLETVDPGNICQLFNLQPETMFIQFPTLVSILCPTALAALEEIPNFSNPM